MRQRYEIDLNQGPLEDQARAKGATVPFFPPASPGGASALDPWFIDDVRHWRHPELYGFKPVEGGFGMQLDAWGYRFVLTDLYGKFAHDPGGGWRLFVEPLTGERTVEWMVSVLEDGTGYIARDERSPHGAPRERVHVVGGKPYITVAGLAERLARARDEQLARVIAPPREEVVARGTAMLWQQGAEPVDEACLLGALFDLLIVARENGWDFERALMEAWKDAKLYKAKLERGGVSR